MLYELAGLAVALGLVKYATRPGKHFYDYSATINQGRPGKLYMISLNPAYSPTRIIW